MRRKTLTGSEQSEFVKNKCWSNSEDSFLTELKLLDKSDEISLPKIIDSSVNSTKGVKLISDEKKDELASKTKTRSNRNSIFFRRRFSSTSNFYHLSTLKT